MIRRLLLTLGLAAAAALHLSVSGQVVVPGLAVLLAGMATIAGPRFTLPQAGQILVVVGTAVLVFVLSFFDAPTEPAQGGLRIQYAIGSGTALLTLAGRLWLREPERGDAGSWVVGLVALAACGRVASPLYLPLGAAYVLLGWVHAAWVSDAGRHRSLRHVGAGVGMFAGGLLLAAGAVLGLRLAFSTANAMFMARLANPEVGFGAGSFELTSMDGMRQSNEVMLRVMGPADERFRGQVYREYSDGTWFKPLGRVSGAPTGRAPRGEVTTIDFVSTKEERLFLPANARAVATTPTQLVVDGLGVPRPGGDPIEEVRFDTTGPLRLPPAAPGPADLVVVEEVALAIGPLVEGWIAGAPSPRDRVAAIEERLEADYTYSLRYERDPDRDPAVQFLTESKLGHCEYFATGMVLAARQAGVPARLVTGFRSTEVSPFGGHRIVRSRDAHAWAEVYLDGGWEEIDPSPQNSLEQGATASFLQGARDDLSVFWERYGAQTLAGVLLLVFVGIQIRTLLRGRKPRQEEITAGWVEGPPDWLLPLLEALATVELVRAPSEPVEAFAARVQATGRAEAGDLLRRYAAFRYGGQGEAAQLAQVAGAWAGATEPVTPGS